MQGIDPEIANHNGLLVLLRICARFRFLVPSDFDHFQKCFPSTRSSTCSLGLLRQRAEIDRDGRRLETISGDPRPQLQSESALRAAERGYYGGISGIDRKFKRLLDVLRQTGQAESTLVVYTADHGEMMGSHKRMAKQVCHVPLFPHPSNARTTGMMWLSGSSRGDTGTRKRSVRPDPLTSSSRAARVPVQAMAMGFAVTACVRRC